MGYELDVVHVAVEARLKEKGWQFQHEVYISSKRSCGKADFLAYDGKCVYIIECKRNCKNIETAIYQVLRYHFLITLQKHHLIDDHVYNLWLHQYQERNLHQWAAIGRSTGIVLPCLIVPTCTLTDEAVEACTEYGVVLGSINTPRYAQLRLNLGV